MPIWRPAAMMGHPSRSFLASVRTMLLTLHRAAPPLVCKVNLMLALCSDGDESMQHHQWRVSCSWCSLPHTADSL